MRRWKRDLLREATERERYYQRTIAELQNKLLYLIDKPWTLPPEQPSVEEPIEEIDFYLPDLEPID